MSQFIEVEIKISDLVHDLRAGLTWFASEDKGHGSIQAKYEMEDEDVQDIMGHPAFNQPIRTFKIVDDYTKKSTKKSVQTTDVTPVGQQEELFPVATSSEEPQSEASYLDVPETESAGALEFLSL